MSLTSGGWYPIVALICIFLTINNGEQFFMCLLAIKISSLKKCFSSFAHFKNWILFCYWVVWIPYIFWILTPYYTYICKYLFPAHRLPFILLFAAHKLFNLMLSLLFIFAFVDYTFDVISLTDQCQGFFPLCSNNFMVLCLIFKFSIHVNFCDWHGIGSTFILLHVTIQIFSSPFIDETIFSINYSWLPSEIY